MMADLSVAVASACSAVTTGEPLELLQITSETENTFTFDKLSNDALRWRLCSFLSLSWAFTFQLLVLTPCPSPCPSGLPGLPWRDWGESMKKCDASGFTCPHSSAAEAQCAVNCYIQRATYKKDISPCVTIQIWMQVLLSYGSIVAILENKTVLTITFIT